MLEEFKKFAMRGNVVDLAVGVIIGAAFGAIVSSLVGDIIMPLIGSITGGLDFSNYFVPLSSKVHALVASCLVFAYAAALKLQDKLAPLHIDLFVETSPAPSKEVELLSEIRDLLKKR